MWTQVLLGVNGRNGQAALGTRYVLKTPFTFLASIFSEAVV